MVKWKKIWDFLDIHLPNRMYSYYRSNNIYSYFEYVQQFGANYHIYQKYSKFFDLRQSEISSKTSEILAEVGLFNHVWLHKAAWRAFLFFKFCDKECYDKYKPFSFCASPDILIGLHVIMLDVDWFYNEFLPKNNFTHTKFDFEGRKTDALNCVLDLLNNFNDSLKKYTKDTWTSFFATSRTTEPQPKLPFVVQQNLEDFPVPADSVLQQFVPPSILGKELHFLIHLFQTWNSMIPTKSGKFSDDSPRNNAENQLNFQEILIKYYDFLSSIMTTK